MFTIIAVMATVGQQSIWTVKTCHRLSFFWSSIKTKLGLNNS